MKAYKGFNNDMTCRGFQYEQGKTYELPEGQEPILCRQGFHACLNPLDCLEYYSIIDSEFHEVDIDGPGDYSRAESPRAFDEDTKICGSKIRIGKRLEINDIIDESIDYINKNCSLSGNKILSDKRQVNIASSGPQSQIISNGRYSLIASSGLESHVILRGKDSRLVSNGPRSNIVSSSSYSLIVSSGMDSQIISSGARCQIISNGDCSRITSNGIISTIISSGKESRIVLNESCSTVISSGDRTAVTSNAPWSCLDIAGANSIAVALGPHGRIKGVLGTWITLAEWEHEDGIDSNFIPICVKSAKIDGEILKPNVWYILRNGEFMEVEE